MTRWHDFQLTGNAPTRWECCDDDCAMWGGNGGETEQKNVRRSRQEAREHAEETGHSVTLLLVLGFYPEEVRHA